MKVKDLQFAKYFLTQEVDLDATIIAQMLNRDIQVHNFQKPDTVTSQGNTVIIHQPSCVTMFIFRILQHLLSERIIDGVQRDKMGVALLHMCRDYVYKNEELHAEGPPVILDVNKIPVPSSVICEIIEPLVGTIELPSVLFAPCPFTDAARIIESSTQLESEYNVDRLGIGHHEYPLVLCNSVVHNEAAQHCHMTIKLLESAVGEDRTRKIVHNILLNEQDAILPLVILILKTLIGRPDYVIEFLRLLESYLTLTEDEHKNVIERQSELINGDKFLNQHIKVAQQSQTQQSARQWSQWSMLMGLIEKQLEPMRGSMWPATENIKPHEDRLRLMIKERTKEKGKTQSNFEELLETSRDLYNHNTVEPGQLIEVLLKENRVWKQ